LIVTGDRLDNSQFEKLSASLPADLAQQSETWHGSFLGEPKDAKPYIVRVEHLAVLETLAHSGIYHFGETVLLTGEEADDVLCEDYAAGTHEAPWRCEPPKVMTAEAYQAAVVEAQRKGISPVNVCFQADVERDAKEKEWYRRNGSRGTAKRRTVARENEIVFESAAKVKVKVKGNLSSSPGTLHTIGEVIEFPLPDAWKCVDSGSVEPV
jgi:hypothetical protein